MESTIPYFINVACSEGTKIKTYTGSCEKNALCEKLLEEISELMVLHSETKKTCPDMIQNVMYFKNNCWNIFDIYIYQEKIMIIYEEKYNNFYVESEEEDSDSESNMESDMESDSEDSLEERWDAILRLYQDAKTKIYESHIRLMEDNDEIIYI